MEGRNREILELLLKRAKPMNDFIETIEPEIIDDEEDLIEPEIDGEEDEDEANSE